MAENKEKKSDVAKREEKILAFWNRHRIFEKSVEREAPKGEYVFYDGPPFATGLPHYGHILAGTIKDAIPRYQTMRGYRVRRRWGWDCHGLPLEAQIEKELGLTSKRDIEALGVDKFNQAARDAVLRYADDWRRIVPRMGRWVDMERDYRTMDADYTETVWHIFKTLYDKKLIYKGYKTLHLSPLLGTGLSNLEVAQNYKDTTDYAVVIKLPLEDEEDTSLLVWTTTAWTLPGNMASAVHRDATYAKVNIKSEEEKSEVVILAKERIRDVLSGYEYKVLEEFPGASLVGRRYRPPFDYYKGSDIVNKKNAWKIYHAPYVSMEEGTGAVHLAPAYGAEDMELAERESIPIVHHVNRDGTFKEFVTDFAGLSAKPKEDPMATDGRIIEQLRQKGLLFKKETTVHSYPHCWRTDAPLLNYAMDSWFVRVAASKEQLVAENKKIHWIPHEIGEKRFGNWLEGVRDWSISRSRYWGAPLPVWIDNKKKTYVVLGSIDELTKRIKRSGNRYLLMRHGEAVSNTKGILNARSNVENPLTKVGKEEIIETAQHLKSKNISLIVYSPLERSKETAMIIAKELSLSARALVEDKRLSEIDFGEFEGQTIERYHAFFKDALERMVKRPERGETWQEVKERTTVVLYELEHKYSGKTILIISHNGPLQMLQAGAVGADAKESAEVIADDRFDIVTGGVRELEFIPLPHNNRYELDLHRPYIDEVTLVDADGATLQRIPDVFDCWFESGSMPYGQHHYPFEHLDVFDPRSGIFRKPKGYPADFIAEGVDQTRGWFYSLLVLGVVLFGRSPYNNVIVNGTVLAEDGQKMSKRLKNYPDPMAVTDRYGADALRYYLLSSPIMRAEDLNFSEKGVEEVMRKVTVRLANVLSFYKLHADSSLQATSYKLQAEHVLDRWLIARLDELIVQVTSAMESYELDRATRPIASFIDDLSTWYVRRSRERFRGEEKAEQQTALAVTRHVLLELSKVMAPFTPFCAEELYQAVRSSGDKESVHLADWPSVAQEGVSEEALLKDMSSVRQLASLALERRARAGIKVRQPLKTLAVKRDALKGKTELLELVKDEVNVKTITFDPIIEEEVMLDTVLSKELKEEGALRDLIRYIQDFRKKRGFTPMQKVTVLVHTDQEGKAFIERHEAAIQKGAKLQEITVQVGEHEGEAVTIGGYTISLT